MKLEIIGFNIESCVIAQKAGADRIELCDNPAEGGTTPSMGFIKAARKKLSIELYVMIRPRGGNFVFSSDELAIMRSDIMVCKELGCDGIVTGLLQNNRTIDISRCRQLVDVAYPLGVTFHRAFDYTPDPFLALTEIIDAGFERILTSGQRKNADEGSELIRELIEKGEDNIHIMPGVGIRADNLSRIAQKTGATEFHSSARTYSVDTMTFHKQLSEETGRYIIADEKEVAKMSEILKEIEESKN
jgi:copper homeostasis protein